MPSIINMQFLTVPNLGGTNLGGGISGIAPKQTQLNQKDSENTSERKVLVKSWNTAYATGSVNGRSRITTPFRAVNNLGDYLGRVNYSCGGPNPSPSVSSAGNTAWKNSIRGMPVMCDNTGIPSSSCNVKWVSDSSDYTTFRKQQATNYQYNKYKFGGDKNNASQVPISRVHRFF